MRVALVGDSHLTETSPRRSVTKLAPRLRLAGLDVVSVAAGGANSGDVLDQRIPEHADWVIYSVGVNDAAPWKTVDLDQFASNCDRLMSAAGAWRRLVLGPGPVIERHVPGERTNDGVAAYADVLRRLSVTHGARFVPMADLLHDVDLADDGVHLNDSGYRKLASRVLVELDVSPSR